MFSSVHLIFLPVALILKGKVFCFPLSFFHVIIFPTALIFPFTRHQEGIGSFIYAQERYFSFKLEINQSINHKSIVGLLSSSIRSNNCHGLMNLAGRPVAAFDPDGLIFAAGVNSEHVKLYDLR